MRTRGTAQQIAINRPWSWRDELSCCSSTLFLRPLSVTFYPAAGLHESCDIGGGLLLLSNTHANINGSHPVI
jgi:hypothetical protein